MKFCPEIVKVLTIQDNEVQCPFCLEMMKKDNPATTTAYSCCNFYLLYDFFNSIKTVCGLHFQIKIDEDNYSVAQVYTGNKIFLIEKINKNQVPSLIHPYFEEIIKTKGVIVDFNFKDLSALKEQIATYIMIS